MRLYPFLIELAQSHLFSLNLLGNIAHPLQKDAAGRASGQCTCTLYGRYLPLKIEQRMYEEKHDRRFLLFGVRIFESRARFVDFNRKMLSNMTHLNTETNYVLFSQKYANRFSFVSCITSISICRSRHVRTYSQICFCFSRVYVSSLFYLLVPVLRAYTTCRCSVLRYCCISQK